jgi:hypothetical protein
VKICDEIIFIINVRKGVRASEEQLQHVLDLGK